MGLYEVQWGRSNDVDTALVIASGDYESIRALYQEKIRDITANESNVNSTRIDSKILSGIASIAKITTIAKIADTASIAKIADTAIIATIDPQFPFIAVVATATS